MKHKKQLAIFINHPQCSLQSTNGIIESLQSRYRFKLFSKYPVDSGFFDNVDMIIIPGGLGDSDTFSKVLENHRDSVRKFVASGGKYLGICMGAYWAGHHYFNILDGIRPVQYIRRPNTDTNRPHAKAQRITWLGKKRTMFFYDGCSLIGPGLDKSDIWATYPNGDAMALIQNNIGLIGCHPESQEDWYETYSWMKDHWHHGQDHKLLLKFVNAMFGQ